MLFEDKVIDPFLENNYKRTIKSVQYLLNPPRSESKNDVASLHSMFLSCVKDTCTCMYDLNVRLLYFSIFFGYTVQHVYYDLGAKDGNF